MRKFAAFVLLSAICLSGVASAYDECHPTPKCDPSPSPKCTAKPSPKCHPSPSPKCHPSPSPKCHPSPSPKCHPSPSPKCHPSPSPKCHPSPSPNCGCTPSPNPCEPDCMNVWDIVRTTPQLSYLARIIRRLGLIDEVKAIYNATIFAPTTVAIEKTLKNLHLKYGSLCNDELFSILSYHIVYDVVIKQQDIKEYVGVQLPTALYLKNVTIATDVDCKGDVSVVGDINSAKIIKYNIKACNDVIVHLVDALLLPAFDTLKKAPSPPSPPPPSPSTLPAVPALAPGVVAANLLVAMQSRPELSIVLSLFQADPALLAIASNGNLTATFFLPTNSAWDTPALVAKGLSVAALKANQILLTSAISQHALPSDYVTTSSDHHGKEYQPLAGFPVVFDTNLIVSVDTVTGTSATIINANNGAGAGVYHIINSVLVA